MVECIDFELSGCKDDGIDIGTISKTRHFGLGRVFQMRGRGRDIYRRDWKHTGNCALILCHRGGLTTSESRRYSSSVRMVFRERLIPALSAILEAPCFVRRSKIYSNLMEDR